jgi:hypothetical protein
VKLVELHVGPEMGAIEAFELVNAGAGVGREQMQVNAVQHVEDEGAVTQAMDDPHLAEAVMFELGCREHHLEPVPHPLAGGLVILEAIQKQIGVRVVTDAFADALIDVRCTRHG